MPVSVATRPLNSWEQRLRRSQSLAAVPGAPTSALSFYSRVLTCQQTSFELFNRAPPVGEPRADLARIADNGCDLLRSVVESGPDALASRARQLLDGESSIADCVWSYWQTRGDAEFFGKALFQPYAQSLTERQSWSVGGTAAAESNRCPRCTGAAQVSILEPVTAGGTGRTLLCATCLTSWPFPRVKCPSCGHEDEGRLGYFRSSATPHVRIDVCDACRRYVKTIDLGRLGIADPLVDDVASAALDLWAQDRGYRKLELNLIGL